MIAKKTFNHLWKTLMKQFSLRNLFHRIGTHRHLKLALVSRRGGRIWLCGGDGGGGGRGDDHGHGLGGAPLLVERLLVRRVDGGLGGRVVLVLRPQRVRPVAVEGGEVAARQEGDQHAVDALQLVEVRVLKVKQRDGAWVCNVYHYSSFLD